MSEEKRTVEEMDSEDNNDSWGLLLQWGAILIVVAVVIMAVLVILGPIIGNTFSDVIVGLQ